MAVLLLHENASFDDQTIYATGNAYKGCAFVRCTIVLKGFPTHLDRCTFVSCIWHLDLVLHDRDQTKEILDFIASSVLPGLPTAT